jgi:hypothetical protein
MEHPITPPPEIVQKWGASWIYSEDCNDSRDYIATRAAQWGSDQELEACCQWVAEHVSSPEAAELRAALATPPPEPPTDEEIEEAAKLIHASMRFAVPDNHFTRDWVEHGNSLMQDEARRTARAVLERWGK